MDSPTTAAVLTLIGTGTLVPDASRGGAAHHLEVGELGLLLDCGPGTLKGLAAAGVAWQRLTHVVFSHYHTDHTGDLAGLLWALTHGVRPARSAPLTIIGPPGLDDLRDGLSQAHGGVVSGVGIPVEWLVVEAGRDVDVRGAAGTAVRLRHHSTPHTPHSVAWRVDTGMGAVGYTGDTGPCAPLGDFFRGCRALVCECSTSDDEPREGHLTPREVGRLARRARPDVIFVTHVYPPYESTVLARSAAVEADGVTVVAGYDGLRLDLGPNPWPGSRVDPNTRSR